MGSPVYKGLNALKELSYTVGPPQHWSEFHLVLFFMRIKERLLVQAVVLYNFHLCPFSKWG